MSIITISRGSYGYGSEIAEKTGRKSWDMNVYPEKCCWMHRKKFNIPEIKLVKGH